MKKRIYDREGFSTGKWSGGETTQFAIYPESSEYIERNFIWRLSSADVEVDESTFTKLPDYDRVLMVMEGEAVLAHGNERSVRLQPAQQDTFDGGTVTKCFGRIKDYNLIFRKGCAGRLEMMEAENEAKAVPVSEAGEYTHASIGLYCIRGYAVVSACGESHMVQEGCQLVLDFEEGEVTELTVMGEGSAIFSEVLYVKTDHAPIEIPEEKATFEDFKTAFGLARSRNKWKKALGKYNDVWYDEALQARLALLDRTYIGFILWILVSMAFVLLAVNGLTHVYAAVFIIVWTVIYWLIISPLIYMLVLPKPIKAHIKQVDSLTEYERQLYEKELAENPATDKILKKYKHRKGEGWDVEKESIISRLMK